MLYGGILAAAGGGCGSVGTVVVDGGMAVVVGAGGGIDGVGAVVVGAVVV